MTRYNLHAFLSAYYFCVGAHTCSIFFYSFYSFLCIVFTIVTCWYTVMFSFALADENFHAPNEFFRLTSISDGLAAWVQILREIAVIPPDRFAPFRQR